MVVSDSIILKVRACTLASGKINGISRTICCTDSCFVRTMLMESGVGRQVCYDSEVAWLGAHPPGGIGKVTGIFGGTAKVYSFGHPWCQASFVAQNGRLGTKVWPNMYLLGRRVRADRKSIGTSG